MKRWFVIIIVIVWSKFNSNYSHVPRLKLYFISKTTCLFLFYIFALPYKNINLQKLFNLEGDGPLAVDCYEAVDRILAGLRTEHIPNVRAIAQLISGKPPADPSHEAWITYARSCVQPGLQTSVNFNNRFKTIDGNFQGLPSLLTTKNSHHAAQCLGYWRSSEYCSIFKHKARVRWTQSRTPSVLG